MPTGISIDCVSDTTGLKCTRSSNVCATPVQTAPIHIIRTGLSFSNQSSISRSALCRRVQRWQALWIRGQQGIPYRGMWNDWLLYYGTNPTCHLFILCIRYHENPIAIWPLPHYCYCPNSLVCAKTPLISCKLIATSSLVEITMVCWSSASIAISTKVWKL
jgi:hypothetical protein